jgi:release factor glutamine methyltransferase
MTVAESLAWARDRLGSSSDSPRLDAEVLLAHALGQSRSHLYTWPQSNLTAAQYAQFQNLVERRHAGWPIAYLVGRQEFWSLELEVSPAVLIPRPETELLVEQVLERLPSDEPARVLDLGTGSGAIALAIASERPLSSVVATDFSTAALEVARRNALRLAVKNVDFREGDWYGAIKGGERFDFILSNPPYIGPTEPEPQQGDCRFEPPTALVAAQEGLAALAAIFANATEHLTSGGWVLVEHGYRQGPAVRRLAEAAGLVDVASESDLQGHPRVTRGRLPRIWARKKPAVSSGLFKLQRYRAD